MERILGEMQSLHTYMETTTDEETFSKFWLVLVLLSIMFT